LRTTGRDLAESGSLRGRNRKSTRFGFGCARIIQQGKSGKLLLAPDAGWEDVPILSILNESFKTNIFIDNEANLAALGEQFFGAAEGFREVLYISAGRGLGGGIINQRSNLSWSFRHCGRIRTYNY